MNTEFKFNKKSWKGPPNLTLMCETNLLFTKITSYLPKKKVDKNTLSRALRQMRNLISTDLSMGAVSTLINTSSFGIILNTELRTMLIQWEDLISDYFEREAQVINYTRHTIISFLDELDTTL
jgi:hypothetical protein